MWDFSSAVPSPQVDSKNTRRRNSLKQLFRGNTTALERSNWASKTGENHAIDDRSRDFLGIDHESQEAFTAAANEEKRLLRKSDLSPSALKPLQALPYKSVAEQLGCSTSSISSIRDVNCSGNDALQQSQKEGKAGRFGRFTSGNGSDCGSTEANEGREEHCAGSLDNDTKEDEDDGFDNDDTIALTSVCSGEEDTNPLQHQPSSRLALHQKQLSCHHVDLRVSNSTDTTSIPATSPKTATTAIPSTPPMISPTTTAPPQLSSVLKRASSYSPPPSPSRNDLSAELQPASRRSSKMVEFQITESNSTADEGTSLAGQPQQQRQRQQQRHETSNNNHSVDRHIDIDTETPVNHEQWDCLTDNAALLMTSSSKSKMMSRSDQPSYVRDIDTSGNSKSSSSVSSKSSSKNSPKSSSKNSSSPTAAGTDPNLSSSSFDDSWSGSVVTALLSPRYLIPDFGIFYGQDNGSEKVEERNDSNVLRRSNSGSVGGGRRSGISGKSASGSSSEKSGIPNGGSGIVDNGGTFTRKTDFTGHFTDSVRATGSRNTSTGTAKKGSNNSSGKGESSGNSPL